MFFNFLAGLFDKTPITITFVCISKYTKYANIAIVHQIGHNGPHLICLKYSEYGCIFNPIRPEFN